MNINVAGIGMTRFGELWGTSPRTLAKEAAHEALSDAGLTINDIDGLVVANMLSGMLGQQEHLGALFAEELGLKNGMAMKVEGACASGGLATHTAVQGLASGMYKQLMVLGVEKMTDHKPEHVASALIGAGTNEERLSGMTFPGVYAILARSYMEKYGISEKDLAAVAVKNHYHASLNPKAQFHTLLTVEKVLKSACVADPLKLLDCSPISDGAAVVILSTEKPKVGKQPVSIIASEIATDTLGVSQRESLTSLKSTRIASDRAYRNAGLTPKDIDVAEVHDCFTIAELLAMEDLGFCGKGNAAQVVAHGETQVGAKNHVIINTSGGLKGCGHPVGATGVKQIVEIVEQLRGDAGARQVQNATIGLTQNVGGSGATAVVHILKKGSNHE